ncbi:MAG TPA: hypothetical protein VGQ04_04820 [Chitinophagaceae bacterium]|nr:hypothetical protein [Chitinophagaceae bacterium]
MKFLPLFCLVALTIFNCNHGVTKQYPRYNAFVFSSSAESENYSIKFAGNDTIFLQERFPKPKQLFYSVIQKDDRKKLDSLLEKVDFPRYDTVYFQNNLQDAITYKFYLARDTTINWVLIYGHKGPKSLYEFAGWLTALKDRQTFHPTNASVDFGDLTYIVLPHIPPPTK